MRRTLPALLLLTLAPGSAFAQDQSFGSWTASCDNQRFCMATASAEGAQSADTISIGRHAEQTYWEIAFAPRARPADEWSDFIFTIDGSAISFTPRAEIGAYGLPDEFFVLGDKAQALLDALVPGTELSVSFTDRDATAQQSTFPLEGLSAALLWIDEQQGRVGNERVAAGPPYGLVPAGSEQTVTPDIPADLLERRRADLECGPLEDLANGRDLFSYPLGEDKQLYILPCEAGAYNFASKIFVFDGYDYFEQSFAEFSPSTGWTGTDILVGANFDPATATLTSFAKGRGLGDCGTSGTWVWNEYSFKLVEFRSKEECDETAGDFPVVYALQNDPLAAPASGGGNGG